MQRCMAASPSGRARLLGAPVASGTIGTSYEYMTTHLINEAEVASDRIDDNYNITIITRPLTQGDSANNKSKKASPSDGHLFIILHKQHILV